MARKPKKTCKCPYRCKYCGVKLDRDPVGHLCHTRNCQWEYGTPDCFEKDYNSTGPDT